MSFLDRKHLEKLGFRALGENVRVSTLASLHNPAAISLGDDVRIDDFCVLSAGRGGMRIGSFVHIAVGCTLIGEGRIVLEDFCNLSSRVAVYSSNDDYSGSAMTNPTVPAEYRAVEVGPVHMGKHVVVGSGSVILPRVSLGEGVAVGALSLVKSDCLAFHVYAGVPARVIGQRQQRLLDLEKQFLASRKREGR